MSVWRAELRCLRHLLPVACALGLAPTLSRPLGLAPAQVELIQLLLLFAFAARVAWSVFPAGWDPLARSLSALPLSRSRLGVAKLGAAACVLSLVPACHTLAELGWAICQASSIDPSRLGQIMGRDAALLGVFLGLAAWVSPWPRLGSLVLACLGLSLAVTRGLPLPAWLDPMRGGAGLWVLLAGGGLLAATFRGGRSGLLRRLELGLAPRTAPWLLRALWHACWGLLVGGVALAASQQVRPGVLPSFPDPSLTVRTRHYRFVTRASLGARARPLIDEADAIYRRVVGLLGGSQEDSARLGVALVHPLEGRSGALGVELHPAGSDRARLAIALRTAESLIEREIGEQGGALARGLARYTAWRAAQVDPFWSRFQLAVAHANRPLSLDELLDPRQLARTRGRQLSAPAGELLVAAWARLHGEGVVADLLSAARGPTPQSAGAWRERLASAGYDLDRAFESALEMIEVELLSDARADLRLPRLHVLEDMSDLPRMRFVAVPGGRVPAGWTVTARLSTRRGPPRQAASAGRLPGGSHSFVVTNESSRPLIQVGLRPLGIEPFLDTVWEEWVHRR